MFLVELLEGNHLAGMIQCSSSGYASDASPEARHFLFSPSKMFCLYYGFSAGVDAKYCAKYGKGNLFRVTPGS